MAAATVLYACTEVGICVGCLAPPRLARGLAQDWCREEVTVSISPGLAHARGYGCARARYLRARPGRAARHPSAPVLALDESATSAEWTVVPSSILRRGQEAVT